MTASRSTVFLAVVFGLLLMLSTSYDKHTRIPQGDWPDLGSHAGKRRTVKTRDVMYRVERFAVTDSTIMLQEVSEILNYDRHAYPPGFRPNNAEFVLPITVFFRELESIERAEDSGGRMALVILGIITAVAIVIVGSLSRLHM